MFCRSAHSSRPTLYLLLTRSRRLSVVAILFLMLWYLVFYGPFHLPAAIVTAVGSAEELTPHSGHYESPL